MISLFSKSSDLDPHIFADPDPKHWFTGSLKGLSKFHLTLNLKNHTFGS